MKSISLLITNVFALATLASPSIAAEKATPKEVYQMVTKASEVLQVLGEEGLAAFNTKGEFAWKDSYVFVTDCSKKQVVAHPVKVVVGLDISKSWDKNPDQSKRKQHGLEMCKGATNPNGVWVEYYWTKINDPKPYRKISFTIQVPGKPYQVNAGIYNDTMTVDQLTAVQVSW